MDKRIRLEIGRGTHGDRVRAWERMLEENVFSVECRDADDDLRTSVRSRGGENGYVTHMRYSRQTVVRRPEMIKSMDVERVIVAAYRGGRTRWRQGSQDLELNSQGVFISDVSRPFEAAHFADMTETCTLQVPKASLERRLGPIDTILLGPNVPLQNLVADFLRHLPECIDRVDAETANRLLDQALDLTALMIGHFKGVKIDPSTHRAGMLLRVKAYIRAHLRDEELSVAQAASALRISSRYVQSLLATEATSFGRFLLAERLSNARREILDPRLIHKQVAEVAFEWGFKNSSHFSRAFRAKYGISPRDAKHMTLVT